MKTIYGRDGNIYETGIRGMNSEPFIQSELVKNELNQLELQYNDYKNQKFNELVKENKQLKSNWNKLKEYIRETKLKEFEKSYGKRYGKTFTQAEIIVCNMILDKMQEIEGSDSNGQ